MARVFQLGLDAQGLARSPHRDAAFEAALVRLVADANGPGVSKWVIFFVGRIKKDSTLNQF
jgi:hypothetical protein